MAYGSLPVDSKVKFAARPKSWHATWCQPTFIQVTQVNSRSGFPIDDSTIYIVQVIIIIIIMIMINDYHHHHHLEATVIS